MAQAKIKKYIIKGSPYGETNFVLDGIDFRNIRLTLRPRQAC